MPDEPSPFDLPDDWSCIVELVDAPDGASSGKAELQELRQTRCVFVVTRQPSREAALERLKFRAHHFIEEWDHGRVGTVN